MEKGRAPGEGGGPFSCITEEWYDVQDIYLPDDSDRPYGLNAFPFCS